MRRGSVKMRRQHIDERLGAVVAPSLGDSVHQSAIRCPHSNTDTAHLDMFIGKSQ